MDTPTQENSHCQQLDFGGIGKIEEKHRIENRVRITTVQFPFTGMKHRYNV